MFRICVVDIQYVEVVAFVLLTVGTLVQSSWNYYYLCLLKLIFNASDRSVKGRCLVHCVVGVLLKLLLLLCTWHGKPVAGFLVLFSARYGELLIGFPGTFRNTIGWAYRWFYWHCFERSVVSSLLVFLLLLHTNEWWVCCWVFYSLSDNTRAVT